MKKLIPILIAAIALCGCVAVPTSRISGSLGGHPFHMSLPKDANVDKIEVRAETNGTVVINIEKMSVKMNPEVISTTAAGQQAMIDGFGKIFTNALSTAISTAIQSAK